jgi:hypothetical protein
MAIMAAVIPAAAHGPAFAREPVFSVIHSTEGPMSDGNARALAINWFGRSKANGGAGTSATDIFDPTEGIVMLDDSIIPYHCGSPGNGLGTGSEHCGSVKLSKDEWLTVRAKAMLDRSARRQAQRAHERGWSLGQCRWLTLTQVAARNVPGFCTHNDIRLALGGTTHSDPGPNFPYSWFMGRIRFWFVNPNGITTPTPKEEFLMSLTDAEQDALYQTVGGLNRRTNYMLAILQEIAEKVGATVPAYDMRTDTAYPNLDQGRTVAEEVTSSLPQPGGTS